MCYTPYTLDYSYFQLHQVKFEETDVVAVNFHYGA
jgi:hypothetical protein